MYSTNHFSRDLVIATSREYKDPNIRRMKINALYEKFGAREIKFDEKLVGWMVGNEFVCYKKRYPTEADAKLVISLTGIRSRGKHHATQVYECKSCGGWHATSKGHLAGKRSK